MQLLSLRSDRKQNTLTKSLHDISGELPFSFPYP
jgi:hypothetical protein